MKRIVLSTLAISLLAASALAGQAAPISAPVAPQSSVLHVDWKKPPHRDVKKRVIVKKKVVKRSHWRNGQKYSDWKRHKEVDWRSHHLRRPGPGQRWVKVDNDYLLVSTLSGIIAGIVASN